MTLHVPLSDASEARLRAYAAASGKDVPSVIAEAIEEKLAIFEEEATEQKHRSRTTEQWLAEFRRWVASHKRVDHFVDDSRESIYEGRGE
ncbi:MAG: hypothetical protein HZB38_00885 [Planctomycetes bacterium]|nr:hypothetical protein [Planctomycetota bacterium]